MVTSSGTLQDVQHLEDKHHMSDRQVKSTW